MSTFKAKILTPEGSVFEGIVNGVRMPGTLGSFEIKHNHAPIVSTLSKGKVKILGKISIEEDSKDKFEFTDKEILLDIESGTVEMNNNNVTLLID